MIERKRRFGLSNSRTESKTLNKKLPLRLQKKTDSKTQYKAKKRHFYRMKLKLATKTSMEVHFTEIVSKCDTAIIL